MIAPRWKKTLRDLRANRARTLIVVLAVAVGIGAVGAVLTADAILTREMGASFAATRPPSAILSLTSVTPRALSVARAHPGVADAQARGRARGRIRTGADAWRVIDLFVIRDFGDLRVSLIAPDSGRSTPGPGEMVLERSSLPLFEPILGSDVAIRVNGVERDLGYVGTVHDAGEAPAWMEGLLYGYITEETAESFGLVPFTEIRLLAGGEQTEERRRAIAYDIKRDLESGGATVLRVKVLEPGVHPHSGQMAALLYLLGAFGVVALALSSVLLAGLVSSMLARQVREIGAMKAIGATSGQVAVVYLAGVVVLGSLAVALGIPLGVAGGRAYSEFAMEMLNFEIVDDSIPWWVFVVQVVVGVAAPLLAAALPLARGAAVTVREAVTDTGITAGSRFAARTEQLVVRIRGLGRPLLLAVRNTMRRPRRLALAVAMLTVGGAAFMAALNAGASWTRTVEAQAEAWMWDLDLVLSSPQPTADIQAALDGVAGVARVETWRRFPSVLGRLDGADGPDVMLFAPPSGSSTYEPPVLSGRWLEPDDHDAIVVNHMLADEEKIEVGDRLELRLADGTETAWETVGVAKELGAPSAFVPTERLGLLTGTSGEAELVRIASESRTPQAVAAVAARAEASLDRAWMPVALSMTTGQQKQSLVDHIVIFVSLLSIMSMLIIVVGGFGLVSTMSLNVMERIRELGVLQAVGATGHQIVRIVVAEGVSIAALSWLVALALSLPLGDLIADRGGDIFLKVPLEAAYSVSGALLWLVLVIGLGAMASAGPALRAARHAVRETLAYQ